MRSFVSMLCVSACVGGLVAQSSVVLPPGYATTEAPSSTSYPWNIMAGAVRAQTVYDSASFTGQGLNEPILVHRLRWRANGAQTTTGGLYGNVTVKMSTCPLDFTAVSSTFAANEGADLTTVFQGAVSLAPCSGASPNTWYVDLPLTTPFFYDPTSGSDLEVEVAIPAASWSGTSAGTVDTPFDATAQGARIYSLSSSTATTGTTQQNVAILLELAYSPLRAFSSGYDGNTVVGNSSTLLFDVDVRAHEGIELDGLALNISSSAGLPGTANVYVRRGTVAGHELSSADWEAVATAVPFVTAGSGTPTRIQIPGRLLAAGIHGFAVQAVCAGTNGQLYTPGTRYATDYGVGFTSGSVTTALFGGSIIPNRIWNGTLYYRLVGRLLPTTMVDNNSNSPGGGVYFDVYVRPTAGIGLTAFEIHSGLAAGSPETLTVYVRRGSASGYEQSTSGWTLMASNVPFLSAGPDAPTLVVLPEPIHLRAGTTAIAMRQGPTGAFQYTNGTGSNETWTDGLVDLTGISAQNVFLAPGTVNAPRVWNGVLHYQVLQPSLLQLQCNDTRGQLLGNSAVGSPAAVNAFANTSGWQGDPGRPGFRGNEAGAGMLARTGVANTNLVATNWPLSVNGSMTMMWWQRMGTTAPGTALAYALGGSGGADPRCFTGGVAGTGIIYRGSSIGDVLSTGSVQAAPNVWQHVCLVVDDTNGRASWYLDGRLDTVVLFTPSTHTVSNAGFNLGWNTDTTNTYPRFYDLDDFRLYNLALTPVEVLTALEAENASVGTFGDACGTATAVAINGLPTVGTGNPDLALRLYGTAPSQLYASVLGLTPRAWGTVDLSSLLGPGCLLEVDWTSVVYGVTNASGDATRLMAVPANPLMKGLHVYGQFLVGPQGNGSVTLITDFNLR